MFGDEPGVTYASLRFWPRPSVNGWGRELRLPFRRARQALHQLLHRVLSHPWETGEIWDEDEHGNCAAAPVLHCPCGAIIMPKRRDWRPVGGA